MTAPTLVVPTRIRDAIVAHAREGAPEEVCGVLAGTRDGDDHRVEARLPAANAAESPRTRYEIDPREQLDLLERIEGSDREVVGFYHSHPRGPVGPSETDAAQATWPGRSYAIASLAGPASEAGEDEASGDASLGSWRWTGDEFVEEALRVVDSETGGSDDPE
ncbi:M67 family metallopeptidase [Halorussus salilacus]|uniref:desampylase n=1 Tax=Halorussus salilacus TaxID=2953750 RepID=UPI0020A0D88F|nr:desampylase [Halorussus salilacus]USZ67263.1 M67 family metallopeptidase [Halorussus salilacus]